MANAVAITITIETVLLADTTMVDEATIVIVIAIKIYVVSAVTPALQWELHLCCVAFCW